MSFYSASFVRQENPGIPVRIKQICTVYSSTAHQHVCTKGMSIKVGQHPGNKAGPFKSHGIIPSWCNFPSVLCNGVLQGAHSIPLHIPIPSTFSPMRKLPYRSRSLLQYGSSHVFLCPLCKFLMSRLQDRCPPLQ